jgi:hypothetical protein
MEQNSIGWGQAIRGRLSKKWGEAHNAYITERYHAEPRVPNPWIAKLIFDLWQFSIARWISRNEFLYGKTDDEQTAKKTFEVDALIKYIFENDRNKILPFDQHLFDIPIEQRLQYTLDQKRLWTECIDIAITAWGNQSNESTGSPQDNSSNSNHTTEVADDHNGPTMYEGRRPRVRLRH